MSFFTDSIDWNTFPATGTESTLYQITVTAPGQVIGTHYISGFETYLFKQWIAGGLPTDLQLRFRANYSSQAGTAITDTIIDTDAQSEMWIPLGSMGNMLSIADNISDTYPYTLTYSLLGRNGTLHAPMMMGQGWQMAYTSNVAAGGSVDVKPNAYIPGRYRLYWSPAGTVWSVSLGHWEYGTGFLYTTIGSNALGNPLGLEIIAPTGAWCLRLTNGDGVPRGFSLFATLSPTLD